MNVGSPTEARTSHERCFARRKPTAGSGIVLVPTPRVPMRPFLLLALLVLLGACATHPGKVDQVRFAADARPVTATTEAGALRGCREGKMCMM